MMQNLLNEQLEEDQRVSYGVITTKNAENQKNILYKFYFFHYPPEESSSNIFSKSVLVNIFN